jgi:hypothetical protein
MIARMFAVPQWIRIDDFDGGGGDIACLAAGPMDRARAYAVAAVFAAEIPDAWTLSVIHRSGWRVAAHPDICFGVQEAAREWPEVFERIIARCNGL